MSEAERLTAIQQSVDTFSRSVVDGLNLPADARCLELGAGAGSISSWLAERFPDGQVVAVDKDIALFKARHPANLRLVQADVNELRMEPGSFELIHARFLLCHLPSRDELLAAAVRWLAPGGWLVVADPYQLPAATSPFPVIRRIMAAYEDRYAALGTDLTWSRRLPSTLASLGLTELGHAGFLGCLGGGERDRWRALLDPVMPELIARGSVTQQDADHFHDALDDPSFLDIPQFTLAAWGRAANRT
ncbi:methyltransferase domain-containing protein [Kribbella catacumbae]|uniref:methyltransferase domain-containing protein n=1 Tax=Kribbella catacumbae TaxID=460086 RepID=UPI0003751FFE|nr:methyltransferase domain-containing protein [Kribbella catacumbae]